MTTLEKVQKAFHVFGIIAKIAMIFCIIGAAVSALGALCLAAGMTGSHAITLFGKPVNLIFFTSDEGSSFALMLSYTVMLTAEAVLMGLTCSYLKKEQADGTPFTVSGADTVRKLGIRFIVLPIITMIIVAVIAEVFDAGEISEAGNMPSVFTGIVLIVVSAIFRYGAELEEEAHRKA
ncbi:MAG: hypothetical protein ACI4NM_05620 [Bullifex sp.]